MTIRLSVGLAVAASALLGIGAAAWGQVQPSAPAEAPVTAAVPRDAAPAGVSYAVPLAPAPANAPEPGSLWWFVKCGGSLMYVIAAMSMLGVALIIYSFVVLRQSQIAPRLLQREIVTRIRAGSMDEVRQTCEDQPTPLSAITMAALDYMADVPTPDPGMLRDVIEGEGSRQADALQGQTLYLLDVAVITPMIGLLGTIFGMMHAFGTVARDIASARPVVLAEGVAQALITTAFGLIVGIPAMMFYAYFRRLASRQVSYLETASTDVLTAFLGRSKAPGERAVYARLRTSVE